MMFAPVEHKQAALVIEDDALIAWAIEGVVRDLGFAEVVVASTGRSAMQAAASTQLDLIVCDLNLGPLTVDGLQLLSLIDPDELVPTLIYTAYANDEIDGAIRERRPKARCLIKPATDRQLATTIRELLAHSPTPQHIAPIAEADPKLA